MTSPRARTFGRYFLLILAGGCVAASFYYRDQLAKLVRPAAVVDAGEPADSAAKPAQEAKVLQLSSQARSNLGLVARPVKLQSYWRTILVPGEIADRPGV